jgi:Amt family ammonium transporter
VIDGGWLNKHWIQLGYQLADSVSGGAYSFFGTCLILAALDFLGKFIPILKLRATEEEEILGIDDVEIGEFAVSFLLHSLFRIKEATADLTRTVRLR